MSFATFVYLHVSLTAVTNDPL